MASPTLPPLQPSREEFRELAAQGNLIPVFAEFIADSETPVSAFEKIGGAGYSFLLESAEQNDQTGRFSILGAGPRLVLRTTGRTATVEEDGKCRTFEFEGDPLDTLRELMAEYRPAGMESMPVFGGGAVGFLTYDVARFFEPTIPAPREAGLGLPDILFMVTRSYVVFDHRLRRFRVAANAHVGAEGPDAAYDDAGRAIADLLAKLQTPSRLRPVGTRTPTRPGAADSNTTREEYMDMVRCAQEFIKAGDIFQIVPSQRFGTEFVGDPLTLYRALRFINPSPYMFCLRCGGDFALVGSSPEVHVKLTGRRVEIRPIAGTRPRGATPEQDAHNAADLLADPKERAEHIMLVDLARNDVGRIAEFDSVRVSDFMTIERYSHVMHIVTNVEGTLAPGRDAYDVMRATFPAGTVSGSPKIRAMQILSDLEKSARGAYAGAVGYFGFDGNLDSCITLRTVVLQEGRAYIQAGAGVVADSTPEGEYQETVNKASGMLRAIELAREI